MWLSALHLFDGDPRVALTEYRHQAFHRLHAHLRPRIDGDHLVLLDGHQVKHLAGHQSGIVPRHHYRAIEQPEQIATMDA